MRAETPLREGSRHLWWAAAAVVLLAGAVVAGVNAYRAASAPPPAAPLPDGDLSAVRSHIAQSPAVPDPLDMRSGTVEVPGLRIYAPLVDVGVRQSDIVVPFDAHKVGVYNGAAPLASSVGTTVLVGHVTNGTERGSFYPLAGAEPGASIWTRDSGHAPQRWAVRSVTTYPRTDLPDQLFSPKGSRRLVLITCGGDVTRVGSTRHYADNVVVEAVPAPQ